MKDNIVTLENGLDYAILDETTVENRKFCFGVKLDSNEKPTNDYEIFEEFADGEDVYLDILEAGDLKKAILIDFTNNYMNDVSELMIENDN